MKRKHTLTLLAFLIPLTAGATEAPGDLTNPYRTQVQTQVVAKSLDQITWSPAITDAGSFFADNTLIGQGTQTATGVNYQNHVSNSSGVIMSNMTSDECHGVLKADAGTSVIKVKLYGEVPINSLYLIRVYAATPSRPTLVPISLNSLLTGTKQSRPDNTPFPSLLFGGSNYEKIDDCNVANDHDSRGGRSRRYLGNW
jgi:hypothetical protein